MRLLGKDGNPVKTIFVVFDMYPPMKNSNVGLSFIEPPIKGVFGDFGSAMKFIVDNNMDGKWCTSPEELRD